MSSAASSSDIDPLRAHEFWTQCAEILGREMPVQQFDTWIRPLRLGSNGATNGAIELVAPNRFVQNWIRDRYVKRLESLAADFFGTQVRVAVNHDEAAVSTLPPAAPKSGSQPESSPGAGASGASSTPQARGRLNVEHTFESFVTGKANQLARAAAVQVADNPGTSYNPLYLYGGVGLGKTHLAQAIGNQVLRHTPGARVRYVHAEQYVTDVVRAYQKKAFDEFKRLYHSLDILIIDDIQFLSNKTRTQEEFFFAFNALIEAHKQVIITCDTYPREIAGMEDRLISRFGWGLTVAIEPPELEMRVAILLKKAESQGLALDDSVAFYIAKHLRSNVRELEGALRKLVAFSKFHDREPTLEVAREALSDLVRSQNRAISIDGIQKTVADFYRVKVIDLHSKKRTADLVKPRQIAMYFTKELTSLSLPEIGDSFGGRDHTTVLHAVRKIAEVRKTDSHLNHELHVLEQTIKG